MKNLMFNVTNVMHQEVPVSQGLDLVQMQEVEDMMRSVEEGYCNECLVEDVEFSTTHNDKLIDY